MHDWKADLDPCRRCGSVRLLRRLGEVECRDCGHVVTPEDGAGHGLRAAPVVAVPAEVGVGAGGLTAVTGAGVGRDAELPGPSGAEAPGLSEEVARALDRVLGRGPAGR
jgi:hypothetical protein